MANFLGFSLLFFIFWVALTGGFNWQQLLIGAAVALFVAYFNRNLLIGPAERPLVNLKTSFRFAVYCLRLLGEVIRANFEVAAIVLRRRMPLSPMMVPMKVDLERAGTRVLLANSITLTPGTLTVLVEDDQFLVHALTEHYGSGLAQSSLLAQLKQVEGGSS